MSPQGHEPDDRCLVHSTKRCVGCQIGSMAKQSPHKQWSGCRLCKPHKHRVNGQATRKPVARGACPRVAGRGGQSPPSHLRTRPRPREDHLNANNIIPVPRRAVRGKSRAGGQYLALLNARRSLRLAHEQTRRPTVRAATATAIEKLDVAIARRGGTSVGRPGQGRSPTPARPRRHEAAPAAGPSSEVKGSPRRGSVPPFPNRRPGSSPSSSLGRSGESRSGPRPFTPGAGAATLDGGPARHVS